MLDLDMKQIKTTIKRNLIFAGVINSLDTYNLDNKLDCLSDTQLLFWLVESHILKEATITYIHKKDEELYVGQRCDNPDCPESKKPIPKI